MFSRDVLQRLSTTDPGHPVLSVYARTDPRDPANQTASPAWLIELRNGLAAIGERLEAGEDRELRLAFRELRGTVESELAGLDGGARGRSVAWFTGPDGAVLERLTLQLPVRADRVVLDPRPFVSPLVDVADRGAPTGVILADAETVRLLVLEQGEVGEPEDSTFDLEIGDWRRYGGSAGGSEHRGARMTSQAERFEARVGRQRERLYADAAAATSRRLDELGWERVLLVAEHQVAGELRAELPAPLAERVRETLDLNLAQEEPQAVADALEPHVETLWHHDAVALTEAARERARAGGAGAVGPTETLGALAEGRVEHLLVDPEHDFSQAAGAAAPGALPDGPEMLAERAVEAAIASSAKVSALPAAQAPALAEAGGISALLRW